MKKAAFVSLGCDKNRVDTEYMLGALRAEGFELVQEPAAADYLVVNTCAFLDASRAESIDTILELGVDKRPGQKLIVTGCLPEKYFGALEAGLPEVDAWLGVEAGPDLLEAIRMLERFPRVSLVGRTHGEAIAERARVLTTPPHLAYLKIADGCDNRCTYCLIPAIRGRFRSVPLEALLSEAKSLEEEGVTELVLVAQDLTRYGRDLPGKPTLTELVRALSALDFRWIRLLYCYPETVTEELIEELRVNPKLAKYIDIPLQHVSDRILKRMGRRTDRAQIESLLGRLREAVPGISVRSTFIVGFPGETREEFEELLAFLRTYRLEHAGFFAYSDEEDAPSFRLKGKIPEAEKQARLLEALAVAEEIQAQKQDAMIGCRCLAVCDGADFEEDCFVGRTEGQAFGADTRLRLSGDCEIMSGEAYEVEIVGRKDGELLAKIV